ncbi:DM13 domain-containing protein [Flexithrix dorotheae]|uniref:DM13 domain-containing protein n=1 Tax=Flexithrix dorotheae TaxID=70993 RepID=UPI000371040E|nr:DM13 domain-containing protein [Flexithrix dorotheae]
MPRLTLQFLLLLSVFTSCIGIDYLDDPIDERLRKLEVTPETAAIMSGETFSFSAVYYNNRGIETDTILNWTSSNPAIATVDNNGKATAISQGQVTITAFAGDFESNKALLTVVGNSNEIATIEISSPSTTVAINSTLQFSAEAKNINDQEITGKSFVWTSSDESIATIDANGLLTGKDNGDVNISAMADGVSSNVIKVSIGSTGSRSGNFKGLTGHTVSGKVTLKRSGDNLLLDFAEDFESQSGPGLFIYLSNSESSVSGGIEIKSLEANKGPFTLEVPSSVELSQYDYVIVHCKPFNIPFGAAKLE